MIDVQVMDGQWPTPRGAGLSLLLNRRLCPLPSAAREQLIVSPHRRRYKDLLTTSGAKRRLSGEENCFGEFCFVSGTALLHRGVKTALERGEIDPLNWMFGHGEKYDRSAVLVGRDSGRGGSETAGPRPQAVEAR